MLIFMELVQSQDAGAAVSSSRTRILAKHGISAAQLDAIEAEGVENDWAPL